VFCLYHPARRTRGDYGRQIRSLADASRRSDRALRLRTLNIDDHPRNHALIAPQRSWMLSPAYDLTPAPLFSQDRRDLAMECGDQGRFANAGNILSQHARFLLEREEAGKISQR
jgi:HipA-like C-terminal domain